MRGLFEMVLILQREGSIEVSFEELDMFQEVIEAGMLNLRFDVETISCDTRALIKLRG